MTLRQLVSSDVSKQLVASIFRVYAVYAFIHVCTDLENQTSKLLRNVGKICQSTCRRIPEGMNLYSTSNKTAHQKAAILSRHAHTHTAPDTLTRKFVSPKISLGDFTGWKPRHSQHKSSHLSLICSAWVPDFLHLIYPDDRGSTLLRKIGAYALHYTPSYFTNHMSQATKLRIWVKRDVNYRVSCLARLRKITKRKASLPCTTSKGSSREGSWRTSDYIASCIQCQHQQLTFRWMSLLLLPAPDTYPHNCGIWGARPFVPLRVLCP